MISMSTLESLYPGEEDVPEHFRLQPLVQRDYLVDGELRQWDGPVQDVYSPIFIRRETGLVPKYLGSYPLLDRETTMQVLQSSVAAYDHGRGRWPTMALEGRIRHLEKFIDRFQRMREEIVRLLVWEIGKKLAEAEGEFERTLEYILKTVEAVKEKDRASSRMVIEAGIIAQIRRAPLGVVLCTGPFNYPLNETFATLIPALIMGNTVLFKPPKLGVLLHAPLLEAFRDCFPPGVVNTVYGEEQEVVGPVMGSGLIDVLAFIGTSTVAEALKKLHPRPRRLKSVLGLEAKNAAIVLADADMELSVRECVTGSLGFNGQRCTALKILFVHRERVDEFIDRFRRAMADLRVGMPWDSGVVITPLPVPAKPEHLAGLVADAREGGARVMNEAGGLTCKTIYTPALLYPVDSTMRIYWEEQFGPVVPVVPFTDIETPLRFVMESDYGQQVSLFGRDAGVMAGLIDPLVNLVCRVNLNSKCQRGPDSFPFTGRKDSAEGTLSVPDALEVFSIRTLVAAKEHPANKELISAIVRARKSSFLSTDFIF